MPPVPLRLRLLSALLGSRASITSMSLEQVEQAVATAVPDNVLTRLILGSLQPGVAVSERVCPGPAGPLRLRVYTPAAAAPGPRPLVVYFHGGGWVLGQVEMGDWLCSTAARAVDAVVVSVAYRLAPRHKFPAAVEDCYAALVWCHAHGAALGADPARLAVMGESAGGNLAAVICLMARDRGGPPLRHQALLYPATDGSLSAPSYRQNQNAPILTAADIRVFYRYYLPEGADPLDWRVSPLYAADHAGLPPAHIIVAGHDPLHDDGVRYAEKLKAAGVPVTLTEYPAMPHGFINFPRLSGAAPQAMAEITRAQRAALGG